MQENKERSFDLGTVLSATTGRMFTNMNNIFDIFNYLANEEIYIHQFPRVAKAAELHILQRYPQLNGVGKDVIINNEEDVTTFLNSQKEIYGNSFPLSPMPEELYQHIDPIEEVIQMRYGKRR